MAYAAYREPPGLRPVQHKRTVFHVLDVIVPCTEGAAVRRSVAGCSDVGILRCEPLLHPHAGDRSHELRVRMSLRLPFTRYADVLHRLMSCVRRGEIGRLISWREHLARRGLREGV